MGTITCKGWIILTLSSLVTIKFGATLLRSHSYWEVMSQDSISCKIPGKKFTMDILISGIWYHNIEGPLETLYYAHANFEIILNVLYNISRLKCSIIWGPKMLSRLAWVIMTLQVPLQHRSCNNFHSGLSLSEWLRSPIGLHSRFISDRLLFSDWISVILHSSPCCFSGTEIFWTSSFDVFVNWWFFFLNKFDIGFGLRCHSILLVVLSKFYCKLNKIDKTRVIRISPWENLFL